MIPNIVSTYIACEFTLHINHALCTIDLNPIRRLSSIRRKIDVMYIFNIKK